MCDVSGFDFSLLERENYQNTQTAHKNFAIVLTPERKYHQLSASDRGRLLQR